MNPVPGTTLQDLFVFQKCILWKFAAPDRVGNRLSSTRFT
jgi:hypothetical protein